MTFAPAKFGIATSNSLEDDAFARKYTIWPLALDLGVKATQMMLSVLYIMYLIHLQGLMLLRLTVQEEMHLQEITLFDLWPWVKVTQNIAQYPLHHVT